MDKFYTFWDNLTHHKTESVHFLGLMDSATRSIWEFPKIRGTVFWGPYDKDPTI